MEYRNPVYTEDGRIDCEINHPEYGWIPFTCDPDDTGAAFDVAGLFAEMQPETAPYVAPPAITYTDEENAARTRNERDYLLRTFVDPIVTNPLRWDALTVEEQEAMKAYRQALLDVTELPGFPVLEDVVWPVYPL